MVAFRPVYGARGRLGGGGGGGRRGVTWRHLWTGERLRSPPTVAISQNSAVRVGTRAGPSPADRWVGAFGFWL